MKSEQEIRERIILLNKAIEHTENGYDLRTLEGEVWSLKWVLGDEE